MNILLKKNDDKLRGGLTLTQTSPVNTMLRRTTWTHKHDTCLSIYQLGNYYFTRWEITKALWPPSSELNSGFYSTQKIGPMTHKWSDNLDGAILFKRNIWLKELGKIQNEIYLKSSLRVFRTKFDSQYLTFS